MSDAEKIAAFYKKVSREATFSEYIPTLAIGEFNAEESFENDKVFHVSKLGLNDEDAEAVSLAIQTVQPQSLQALYMGENEITEVGFNKIVENLWAVPGLEVLFFAKCQIGPEGMNGFMESMQGGTPAGENLRHLALQSNKLGDEGLKVFADFLSMGGLPNLEWLYLTDNDIGDEGLSALASALLGGNCKKLSRLAVQDNRIGDEGMMALAAAVKKGAMRYGEYIYIQRNNFTEAGEHKLKMAAKGTNLQVHFGWPPPRTFSFLAEGPTHPQEIEKYKKYKWYEMPPNPKEDFKELC
eukprot:CAMPEP_0119326956 /NCGR_PEP_ID=MMETSP1333-20130426/69609_1 /TAXON_ID=418940 /ORGANISM="Scyphosphaera apsteinii, Strain RCC1455" /LENGTH=296 /DNA_ID=CAMNT_0007335401 /DNA_START=27 /DNA_END=917 /DNA_ORIENTATION=-